MSAGKDGSPTGVDPREDPRWELVRAAARAPVTTPPGLIERVLRSVNGMRGRLLAEPVAVEQAGGSLVIGERALVLLCRKLAVQAAREIGGLHVWATALDRDGFEVLVAVRYGMPAGAAADRLGRDVHRRMTDMVGARVPVVNVHIADVHRA